MPTHYEYAVFSLAVYRDPTDNVPNLTGWQSFRTSDSYDLSQAGYFGAAYINSNTTPKQLVIAHRGTDNAPDYYTNGQIFANAAPTQFVNSAAPFIQRVKADLGSALAEYAISYTGHSLGGALAELSAAQDNLPAVTFDSPGTVPVINTMVTNSQLPAGALTNANNNVKTYNAAPNLVNTLNAHVGTLYRVYPPYDVAIIGDATSEVSYTTFSANQHKMPGILAQFNPSTGLPKVVSQPTSWPVGTLVPTSGYENYKKYSANPYFWDQYFAYKQWSTTYRQSYIYANLGGYGDGVGFAPSITGDDSGNALWGGTTKMDTVRAGIGPDHHYALGGTDFFIDRGGYDTYHLYSDRTSLPYINDFDGKGALLLDEAPLAGTAVAA